MGPALGHGLGLRGPLAAPGAVGWSSGGNLAALRLAARAKFPGPAEIPEMDGSATRAGAELGCLSRLAPLRSLGSQPACGLPGSGRPDLLAVVGPGRTAPGQDLHPRASRPGRPGTATEPSLRRNLGSSARYPGALPWIRLRPSSRNGPSGELAAMAIPGGSSCAPPRLWMCSVLPSPLRC